MPVNGNNVVGECWAFSSECCRNRPCERPCQQNKKGKCKSYLNSRQPSLYVAHTTGNESKNLSASFALSVW